MSNIHDLPEIDAKKTAKNIKRMMKKCRMDHFNLALILRLRSTSTIYSWTQGRCVPSAESLLQLANIFGCQIEDLIGVKDDSEGEDDYEL